MIGAFSGFAVIACPIIIGYIIARTGILSADEGRALNRLAFFALVPVLLFDMISQGDFRLLWSAPVWVTFAAALAMFALYTVVAVAIFRQRLGDIVVGSLAAGYTNSNNIGLPIALHILGNGALVAPIMLYQTALLGPLALVLLEIAQRRRGEAQGRSIARTVLGAMVNPIVLGSLLGVAWSAMGWQLPAIIREPLSLVGSAAVPVVLIAFGISLRGRSLLAPGPSRLPAVYAGVLKMIVMPLSAYLIGRYVAGLDPNALRAVTTLAALPTAQNVFNYANRYDQSLILARDSISLTTLATAPVILAITWLLA